MDIYCIPSDGGFELKWIESNAEDSEKERSIMHPSGSQVAPYHQQKEKVKSHLHEEIVQQKE